MPPISTHTESLHRATCPRTSPPNQSFYTVWAMEGPSGYPSRLVLMHIELLPAARGWHLSAKATFNSWALGVPEPSAPASVRLHRTVRG